LEQPSGKIAAAPVVRARTVVVFWLHAVDTLDADDRRTSLQDLRDYTDRLAPYLADRDIKLVGTNADSVWVELPRGARRLIMLTGLDYPYGYVLITPGEAEEILTGISTDDEMVDAARDYFDIDDADSSATVVTLSRGASDGDAPDAFAALTPRQLVP
jgi:hypothetical protein